jgi:hypothetical protein
MPPAEYQADVRLPRPLAGRGSSSGLPVEQAMPCSGTELQRGHCSNSVLISRSSQEPVVCRKGDNRILSLDPGELRVWQQQLMQQQQRQLLQQRQREQQQHTAPVSRGLAATHLSGLQAAQARHVPPHAAMAHAPSCLLPPPAAAGNATLHPVMPRHSSTASMGRQPLAAVTSSMLHPGGPTTTWQQQQQVSSGSAQPPQLMPHQEKGRKGQDQLDVLLEGFL